MAIESITLNLDGIERVETKIGVVFGVALTRSIVVCETLKRYSIIHMRGIRSTNGWGVMQDKPSLFW